VTSVRNFYKVELERMGYTVCIPRDTGVAWIPSGLVTAVLSADYELIADCFCPFEYYCNIECFVNKGFHSLRLRNRRTDAITYIVNTHTQSDTEISWFFGRHVTSHAREKQMQQICDFFKYTRERVLVVGDLNCEKEPHPGLRFLHPHNCVSLKKATFYSTGEDLDHVAYLTDREYVPRLVSCRIYDIPLSDHAPVYFCVD
jgi:hypothetical protein